MQTARLTLVALLLALVGCATRPKVDVNAINWNSRIGSYTYDQAVAELGKPNVVGESSDGKTAEWVVRREPRMSFGFGVGGATYGRHTGVGVGVGTSVSPPPRGENLRLKFDKDGKLSEWTKVNY